VEDFVRLFQFQYTLDDGASSLLPEVSGMPPNNRLELAAAAVIIVMEGPAAAAAQS